MKITLTPRYKAAIFFAALLFSILGIALIADRQRRSGTELKKSIAQSSNANSNTTAKPQATIPPKSNIKTPSTPQNINSGGSSPHSNSNNNNNSNNQTKDQQSSQQKSSSPKNSKLEKVTFSNNDIIFAPTSYPDYESKDVGTVEQFERLETPKLRTQEGFVGISNKGNSCYADSILQMLFRIPSYRKIIGNLSVFTKSLETSTNALIDKFNNGENVSQYSIEKKVDAYNFCIGLNHIFHQLQNNSQNEAARFDGLSMKCMPKKFSDNDQEDAEEYFVKASESITNILPESLGHLFLIDYEEVNADSGAKYPLQLDKLFLPLPEKPQTLIQLLDSNFAADSDRKGKRLTSIPDILPIMLFRLGWGSKGNKRNHFKYEMPVDLDMSKYYTPKPDLQNKSTKYRLKMFVVHGGGANSGHFLAYSREDDGHWMCLNDSSVTKITEDQAVKEAKDGYMFFYERFN